MSIKFTSMVFVLCCLLSQCEKYTHDNFSTTTAQDPITYVNPFIGTDGKGKTYPGATMPYGMVQLSPDNGRTGWDWIAGYFYPDNIIAGFSHTHLSGTGAGDLYDISFMPFTYPPKKQLTQGGPASGTLYSEFSHTNEQASAGYYQVFLSDYKINVELTAGLRTGYQRYNFQDTTKSTGNIQLDLQYSRNWDKTEATCLQIIDSQTLAGYRYSTGWATHQKVYFYSRFSQPVTYVSTPKVDANGCDQAGQHEFTFALNNSRQIEIRTAISSVSIANAKQNLLNENESAGFDQIKNETVNAWRKELSQVTLDADTETKVKFYTSMYHAALAPRIYSDSNGEFRGPDGEIHKLTTHNYYDFFSLWDTFRALHPWKTLFDTQRNQDMLYSLLAHYEISGRLPVWTLQGQETDMMLGYHSVPVLVDSYLKGLLPTELGEKILQAALQSAQNKAFGLSSYQQLGYVPYSERKWNVALTLEYAYDDWAISRLAQKLGKTNIANEFQQRAQSYKQLFDKQTGFMRAKDAKGLFREPFNPESYFPEDYCEANAWQYSFFVPHDVEGLIALYGGNAAFVAKLDAVFTTEQHNGELPEWISGFIGQYVHGNEPTHHMAYLYQYANQPAKTQAVVRRIMNELYSTKPDGLAGNEDAGQMSAWYLFSALGFYPVDPVSGNYVLGSPQVKQAKLQLGNGKTLSIYAKQQSPENIYVQSVFFNGHKITDFKIAHNDIMRGGDLIFLMSNKKP